MFRSLRVNYGLAALIGLGLVLLQCSPGLAGSYKDASKRHEGDCKKWCSENEDCGKCLPLLPCPPGTKRLKSWKGYGKNWHACSRPGQRQRVSKEKLEDCKKWCSEHEDCGKCLPALPCPPGTKKLKSWSGYGKNWYACSRPGQRQRVSKEKLEDCKKWCSEHEDCGKCLPALPCPPGTKKLKSWSGYGKNFYACSKPGHRQRVSKDKLEDCRGWCRNNLNCGKCLPALPCPPGTKKLKSWSGYGKNFYACSTPGNRRRAKPQELKDCEKWCGENAQCEVCRSKGTCPDGTQPYATFGYYQACGRPGTVSSPGSREPEPSQRRPGTPAVHFQ